MDSILTSVKKMLGIAEEYTHFDADLIMHINTVFTILNQLGVGPSYGFRIEDADDEWVDFLDDQVALESVKTYMAMKVKLMFDPPASSSVMEATNRMVSELEWRLNVTADQGD